MGLFSLLARRSGGASAEANYWLGKAEKAGLNSPFRNRYLSNAIRADPSCWRAYFSRAANRYSPGGKDVPPDYDGALSDLTQVINLAARSTEAYCLRASIYSNLEDFSKALVDLDQAVLVARQETVAARADIYLRRSEIHRKLGNLRACIADSSEAIALDPENTRGYVARGWTYLKRGDVSAARADFDTLVRLDPEAFYYVRARFLEEIGDIEAAISDYGAAIALDRKPSYLYLLRGQAYLRKGDLTQAVEDLTEALRIDRFSYGNDVHIARAKAYQQLGNIDAMYADLNEVIPSTMRAEALREMGLNDRPTS